MNAPKTLGLLTTAGKLATSEAAKQVANATPAQAQALLGQKRFNARAQNAN
jgi:hypothetical protein